MESMTINDLRKGDKLKPAEHFELGGVLIMEDRNDQHTWFRLDPNELTIDYCYLRNETSVVKKGECYEIATP